jgi:hypothetical protein
MNHHKGAPVGVPSTGMDPKTLGQFSAGASAAGGLLSVIGAIGMAQGQKSQLAAEAELARINAVSAENAARSALMVGQREEQRSRLATARLKSRQQVSLASNGVDLGEGSAARMIAETDILGEIDANTIAANAVQAAWGYRTQATNFQMQASMRDAQSKAVSPGMAGASSLLTAAGQVADHWYFLNKTRSPSGG